MCLLVCMLVRNIGTKLVGRRTSATGADETSHVSGTYKEKNIRLAVMGDLYRFMESTSACMGRVTYQILVFHKKENIRSWSTKIIRCYSPINYYFRNLFVQTIFFGMCCYLLADFLRRNITANQNKL
jgi:hypothetical protein